VDARACYTAMAAAHMLRLDGAGFARQANMVDFLRRCQVQRPLHTRSACRSLNQQVLASPDHMELNGSHGPRTADNVPYQQRIAGM